MTKADVSALEKMEERLHEVTEGFNKKLEHQGTDINNKNDTRFEDIMEALQELQTKPTTPKSADSGVKNDPKPPKNNYTVNKKNDLQHTVNDVDGETGEYHKSRDQES